LRSRGYDVLFVPDEAEAIKGFAFNFVTLGPRQILMPARCPGSQAFYEAAGITCHVVEIRDLHKAAGSIGCLTGIVRRAR
jgi:N-dimethylarginine dimethylaminohydrolase